MTAKNKKYLRLNELEKSALEKGAYRAKIFSSALVVMDPRVRLKCQIPLCPHYGQCLTCPPNVPSYGEFREALAAYKKAILLQIQTPVSAALRESDKREAIAFYNSLGGPKKESGKETNTDLDNIKLAALRLHKLVNEVENMAMSMGFPYALGLIGGSCMLCSRCAGPGGAGCRRPYEARPSLEGVGIDVIETSFNAGLPIEVPPRQEIIWTGLVLID